MNHGTEPTSTSEAPTRRGRVSPDFVRVEILDRSMEATCHNLWQFNSDQEVNSVAEFMEHSVNRLRMIFGHHAELDRLTNLVAELKRSNVAEGSQELLINGAADQLARDIKSIESNSFHRAMGARTIAKTLREPLRTLLSPADHSAREVTEAHRIVHDIVGRVPVEQLLAARVEKDLAPRKFRLLKSMVEGPTA